LIDLNAFDFVDVDLYRPSADKAMLDDYPLGRDRKLGGLVPDIGLNQKDEAEPERGQQNDAERYEMPLRPKADVPETNDLLVLDQRPFNVTRHAVS
jgi:hypothetical protein